MWNWLWSFHEIGHRKASKISAATYSNYQAQELGSVYSVSSWHYQLKPLGLSHHVAGHCNMRIDKGETAADSSRSVPKLYLEMQESIDTWKNGLHRPGHNSLLGLRLPCWCKTTANYEEEITLGTLYFGKCAVSVRNRSCTHRFLKQKVQDLTQSMWFSDRALVYHTKGDNSKIGRNKENNTIQPQFIP